MFSFLPWNSYKTIAQMNISSNAGTKETRGADTDVIRIRGVVMLSNLPEGFSWAAARGGTRAVPTVTSTATWGRGPAIQPDVIYWQQTDPLMDCPHPSLYSNPTGWKLSIVMYMEPCMVHSPVAQDWKYQSEEVRKGREVFSKCISSTLLANRQARTISPNTGFYLPHGALQTDDHICSIPLCPQF